MKKYSPSHILSLLLILSVFIFSSAYATPTGPGGKDTRGIFAIYFLNMKKFLEPTCTGPSIVLGFDSNTMTPKCRLRDDFMKDYFGTQSAIVPEGNVVTGFSISGTLVSTSASGMIATVFSNMPLAPAMQALIGFDTTGPVYNQKVGYWEDNGGASIKYDGKVQVGNGFTYGITTNKVSSPTNATAGDHLVRKVQFLSEMQALCATIAGDWNGSICIPKDCTGNAGGTINHNTNKTFYKDASVAWPATCQSQTRFCNNGTLSGSYTNLSCIVTHTQSWKYSDWGNCSASCGDGTMSRDVWCERDDGYIDPDSQAFCDGDSRPLGSTGCNNGACCVPDVPKGNKCD